MSDSEGSGSPTPSEQDYNEDKYEENIMEQDPEVEDDAQGLSESLENNNYQNLGIEDDDTQAENAQGVPESGDNDNDMNPGVEAEDVQNVAESGDNDNYLSPEVEAEDVQNVPESGDNNNNMNPGVEAEDAQNVPENKDAEMVQPAQNVNNIMAHNPYAGPGLEEELGGMIVVVIHIEEFLVLFSDLIPPEL